MPDQKLTLEYEHPTARCDDDLRWIDRTTFYGWMAFLAFLFLVAIFSGAI